MRTLAEKLAGTAAIVQVNTQENPALASRFGVRGVPVIMLLHHGRVVDQISGARTVEAVVSWFRKHS